MSEDQDIKVTLTPPKEIHVVGSAALGPPGPPGPPGNGGNGGGGSGGALDQGAMHSYLDANGDFWMVQNAELTDGVWNRIDTTDYSFAMQWITKGIIPGEEGIDPIGGIVFWRCIPGANPIGPFAAFGGWENVYLMTQYRDFVVGGQAIEMDGAGTFPFGRFIHAPEGTFMCQNAYADLNGRDDNSKDSLIWGMFGEEIKARLWKANEPKESAIDLLTLDKSGNLSVAGTAPGGGGAGVAPSCFVTKDQYAGWATTVPSHTWKRLPLDSALMESAPPGDFLIQPDGTIQVVKAGIYQVAGIASSTTSLPLQTHVELRLCSAVTPSPDQSKWFAIESRSMGLYAQINTGMATRLAADELVALWLYHEAGSDIGFNLPAVSLVRVG